MARFAELYDKLKNVDPKLTFMDSTFTDYDELLFSTKTKHAMEFLSFFMQSYMCIQLEAFEPECKFKIDRWYKSGDSGGGVSCILQNGKVIEKGGVNVSVITGDLSNENAAQMRSRGYKITNFNSKFNAVGVSSVIHPVNPHSPTLHFNFRYFEIEPQSDSENHIFWFGGGCDLTPNYIYKEDIVHFHQTLKNVCDKHNPSYYLDFKKWADDYFYIPHREERRGIGGIFFDDLTGDDPLKLLDFMFECSICVIPSYIPILARTCYLPYTEKEVTWQKIRHGRYVEFNIMYDRGTKFGLCVPGSRVESILMSLPLNATWLYCHSPPPDSKEADLLEYTKKPFEWV